MIGFLFWLAATRRLRAERYCLPFRAPLRRLRVAANLLWIQSHFGGREIRAIQSQLDRALETGNFSVEISGLGDGPALNLGDDISYFEVGSCCRALGLHFGNQDTCGNPFPPAQSLREQAGVIDP